MDELFRVSVEKHPGATVVTVVGEVDVSSAPELRARLLELDERQRIVVDLSEVTFLDSTGLGVLVGALKRTEATRGEGELRLVVNRPQLTKVLEVTGLAPLFAIYPVLSEALAR